MQSGSKDRPLKVGPPEDSPYSVGPYPVLVIGAGGHARTLLAVLRRMQIPVLGLTSQNRADEGKTVGGVKVLGTDAILKVRPDREVRLVNGVGTDATTELRRRVFARLKAEGFRFLTTCDPSVVCADSAKVLEGCQLQMGAIIQAGVHIGVNTIVNTGALVDHDCRIGAHVHLAPGTILCGSVRVEDGCFIGAGSVLRQGVQIGEGCTVGAGSVVLGDLPAHSLCYGHPARVIRKLK